MLQQSSNENVQVNNEIDSSHSSTDPQTSTQSSDIFTSVSSVNHEHTSSHSEINSTEIEHGKNHTDNVPVETSNEVTERLFQRRLMQSLMHLIPPNLWAQIQKNYTMNNQNKPQYGKPILPNPVHLAESAAQAGLPGPGPYPIPDNLWHRNPVHIVTRPAPKITCKFKIINNITSLCFFFIRI